MKPAVDLKRCSRRTSIGHDSMFEHCHYLLKVVQTEPNFLEACSTSAGKVLKPFSRTRVGIRLGVYVESTASGALPFDMPRSSGHDPAARRDDCRDGSKSCLRIPAAGAQRTSLLLRRGNTETGDPQRPNKAGCTNSIRKLV